MYISTVDIWLVGKQKILEEEIKMTTFKNYASEVNSNQKNVQDKIAGLFFVVWLVSIVILLAISPRQNIVVNDTNAEPFEKPYILID